MHPNKFDVLQGKLDPKKLQLQLTGFLEKSTGMFMEELWGLLVDAQSSLGGIPSAFLQDKKDEMAQAKVFVMMLLSTVSWTQEERAYILFVGGVVSAVLLRVRIGPIWRAKK